MTKLIVAAFATAALIAPSAALAGNAGDGSDYGTQPGFTVSQSHTACSGMGAFGILGKDYNMAGGANGYLTGYYSSGICGNRQGNLPS